MYLGLRALDVPFQYSVITSGYAAWILNNIGYTAANTQSVFGPGILGRYSLGGLNATATVVLGLIGVASFRQVYWSLSMLPKFNAGFSLGQGVFVGTFEGIISLVQVLTLVATSSRDPLNGELGWKQYVGLGLFVSGVAWEIIPEEARKKFRSNPENKGKLCDVSGFGIVRQPNYLGYTLWRAGITLATGNITAAALLCAFHVWHFTRIAIPANTKKHSEKYGEQWTAYTKKVPYAYIPFVY